MRIAVKAAGLEEPEFERPDLQRDPFEGRTEPGEEKAESMGKRLGIKLGINEEKILALIAEDPHMSGAKMALALGISKTAVENNLRKLKERICGMMLVAVEDYRRN